MLPRFYLFAFACSSACAWRSSAPPDRASDAAPCIVANAYLPTAELIAQACELSRKELEWIGRITEEHRAGVAWALARERCAERVSK